MSRTVTVRTPAQFEVSNLVFNPSEVEVGQTVGISVTVTNTGDLQGMYTVTLKINGEVEATEEVTLAGGATETVSFTVTENTAGTYTIGVNGLQRALSVLEPATFKLTNLTISPSQVELGESVEISVDVKNEGDVSGTYTVTLRIDGATESTQGVTLAGGENRRVSFTVTKNEAKSYSVTVDGLTGTFSVRVPSPEFEVTNLTITPAEVEVGNPVTVSCNVRNKGDAGGTYTLTLKINGITEATRDVTLAAGATETVSFTIIENTVQTYNVEVDGLTGAFTVTPPVTLYPIADAYVNCNKPQYEDTKDVNYGGSWHLNIIYDFGYTERANSYLMFDLSTIPSTAQITEAKLELYAWSTQLSEATEHVGVHYCPNTSWSEVGITWNNAPSFSTTPTDVISVAFEDTWYSWDITSDVQSALSTGKLTVVLKIEDTGTAGYISRFYSKDDYGDSPRLVIDFS